ncbi:MAG: secretion protein HlyD family protein [Chthonomonadales bacterium]|nr:secretion protein HlyD family protein [Chthonomonadales bacterium]
MNSMQTKPHRLLEEIGLCLMLLCVSITALAGPVTQAGPYRIELTTKTGVIPTTGGTKLLFKVTDGSGKAVEGVTLHSLTKMPGMNMGEREEMATPVPGEPGVYTASASFAMEGGYEDTLKVEGPLGPATAKITLSTGQNIAAPAASASTGAASSPMPWIAALLVVAFLVFVLMRMKQTGQPLSIRGIVNRSVIGGLLLLGLIFWGALYAVNHFRRPGAWTHLEAQEMEMNLPAPVGTAPVEIATVESGSMESTVRYTGQAVGYVEQEVTPRVTGVITWMPFYAGDRVKRGELLARLDTSQSAPQVASQQGQVAIAQEGVGVAQKDYQQALAMINEAHAEVGTKQGAIDAARADVAAVEQERANAQAGLEAAQSMSSDAAAALQATQADQQYWREELNREASLLKAGAVTQEEYQRERAQAQNADAKVRQAQAHIVQVQAQIRAAQSEVQRSDAMITSSKAKLQQAQSDLSAHEAHVRSAQAAADSAKQKIVQAQAGVQQARGMLASASATQGYSEIRSQTEGVITQRIISPGTLVSPGQILLKVAQISPIRLQANVTEADLQKVRVGSRVLVNNPTGNRSPAAHITSIAPSIDPTARTGIVEVVVNNGDSRFLPGQYVTMDLSIGHGANTLHIPTRALRYHTSPSGNAISLQSTPTVWVVDPVPGQESQYTVHEVTVKTGLSDTAKTEILSGLEAGQKVVTAGQDYLKNGDTVSLIKSQVATGGTR